MITSRSSCSDYPALSAYINAMCMIPAGTFQMGSLTGDCDQRPVHNVSLDTFRMGATPVTVAIWKEYCAATGTPLAKTPEWGWLDDHPVVNISWNDIMGLDGKDGFCTWASDVSGIRLTLPMEAQFEYAARGENDSYEFPWGNTFDRSKLWCSTETVGDAGRTASVVRTTRIFRNGYGLTDVVGNVYQWCGDSYVPYTESSVGIPPSTVDKPRCCARGASWRSAAPAYFRIANRSRFAPTRMCSYLGFRIAAGAQ